MVRFIIVERTICDAIGSIQAGPAPFTPPRQRRETMFGAKFRKAAPMAMPWPRNFPTLEKYRRRRMTSPPIRNSRAVAA